jgi:hypothetical protein
MVQDAISTVLLCAWLGGLSTDSNPGEVGRLLTLEQIGEAFNGMSSQLSIVINQKPPCFPSA